MGNMQRLKYLVDAHFIVICPGIELEHEKKNGNRHSNSKNEFTSKGLLCWSWLPFRGYSNFICRFRIANLLSPSTESVFKEAVVWLSLSVCFSHSATPTFPVCGNANNWNIAAVAAAAAALRTRVKSYEPINQGLGNGGCWMLMAWRCGGVMMIEMKSIIILSSSRFVAFANNKSILIPSDDEWHLSSLSLSHNPCPILYSRQIHQIGNFREYFTSIIHRIGTKTVIFGWNEEGFRVPLNSTSIEDNNGY